MIAHIDRTFEMQQPQSVRVQFGVECYRDGMQSICNKRVRAYLVGAHDQLGGTAAGEDGGLPGREGDSAT